MKTLGIFPACARMILAASAGHGGSQPAWQVSSRVGPRAALNSNCVSNQKHRTSTWMRRSNQRASSLLAEDWPRPLPWVTRAEAAPQPLASHRLYSSGAASVASSRKQETPDEEDRNVENTKRVYALKLKRYAGPAPAQCRQCWHDTKHCCCPAETSSVADVFPHRVVIYMHVKVCLFV
jgi:hypothetical protein